MKKSYLIFSLLICVSFIARTQEINWQRLNPDPIEVDLKEVVHIPGSDRIIAVGENAVLMYSDDFAASWVITYQPADIKSSSDIIAINCIDGNNIYALSSYGTILKSSDAGLTWIQLDSGIRHSLLDICFLDEDTGFVTKVDTIFKTTDGGNSWDTTGLYAQPFYYPQGLHFVDDSTGFMGSLLEGNIIKTNNRGSTWDSLLVDLGSDDIYPDRLLFISKTTAFLSAYDYSSSGDNCFIFKSEDEGKSWNQVYSHYFNSSQFLFFTDSLNGFALGQRVMYDNMILRTEDGGDTWAEAEMCPNYWNLTCLSVSSEGYGVCVGDHGQIITSDNWGEAWEKSWKSIGNVYKFGCSAIVDDSIVYIGSSDYGGGIPSGGIYKSVDYGLSWERLWSDDPIIDISFYGNAGAVFSEYGSISYTPNGGQSWFGRQQFFDDLFCGYTLNDSVGFALIANELIKTTDTWLTYRNIDIPGVNADWITQVEFKNQNQGFAVVPDRGILLRTNDAGENWYYDSIGFDYFVNRIKFINSSIGFISGASNILKTIDGGDSWFETEIDGGAGAAFSKFSFPSDNTLYVIANNAENNVFRSIDGGDSWNPVSLECTSSLKAIGFFDNEKGLVFGEGGLIFTTDSTLITSRKQINTPNTDFGLGVYPNPAINFINIDLEKVNSIKGLTIDVVSLDGILQNTIIISGSAKKLKYDCSKLKPGAYILRSYKHNKLLGTKKFIKN